MSSNVFKLMVDTLYSVERARANVMNAAYGNSVFGYKGDRDFSNVSLDELMGVLSDERQALRKAFEVLQEMQSPEKYQNKHKEYSRLLENSPELEQACLDAASAMNRMSIGFQEQSQELRTVNQSAYNLPQFKVNTVVGKNVMEAYRLLKVAYENYVGLCTLTGRTPSRAPRSHIEHYLGWPESAQFFDKSVDDTKLPLSLEKCLHFAASCYTMAACSKSKRRACGSLLVRVLSNGVPVIVSSGVNGSDPGTDNACEPDDLSYTFSHIRHAEEMCLAAAPSPAQFDNSYVLFVTDSPCEFCFAKLKARSIKHVVYSRGYRIQDHLSTDGQTLTQIPLEEVEAYIKLSIERMHKVIC